MLEPMPLLAFTTAILSSSTLAPSAWGVFETNNAERIGHRGVATVPTIQFNIFISLTEVKNGSQKEAYGAGQLGL